MSRSTMSPSSATTSYGQVIEYIQDRLYLASYTHAPNAQTPFPYPTSTARTPSKRSARSQQALPPVVSGPTVHPPVYFSIDDSLLYNAFHHDFGPLHIGHLYRFAVQLHDILGDSANEGRGVVFWSKADARSRANAACLLACYMVLIQSWPPHLALAPIAQADPPLMPFRDAGYSQADYVINVQDVVYGVWKAKEEGLCGLRDFSLEEYEKYERVDMGDFNWLTPSFLAFASPQHTPTTVIPPTSPLYATLPATPSAIASHPTLPGPFKNVLSHFSTRNIGLVVRLNSELYSPSYFTALGISHIDMIFDDGTCPPLPLVKRFIRLAHDTITVKKKGIAVHCKAGLGRTGCLIGAYLIYRHGFTANEIIAFMRFMRPGMVVGPQQHWLHLNQGAFREWWFEDTLKAKLATTNALPSTPTKTPAQARASRLASNGRVSTPPNRAPLGEVDQNHSSPPAPADDANLPAPTPGQPRKTSRVAARHHPYSRHVSAAADEHTDEETDLLALHRQLGVGAAAATDDSDEEVQLRLLASRRVSRSPADKDRRAVSCSTTTTTVSTVYTQSSARRFGGEEAEDVENRSMPPSVLGMNVRDKVRAGSGAGVLAKTRGGTSPKRESFSAAAAAAGVRKSSGRVGSVGAVAVVGGGGRKL